jgi:hypothetical protein
MVATSLERVSDWKAVLAAMAYLATFLSAVYGCFSLGFGAAFFKSFAVALPFAFAISGLLFACLVAFEAVRAVLKKSPVQAKRISIQTYVHR